MKKIILSLCVVLIGCTTVSKSHAPAIPPDRLAPGQVITTKASPAPSKPVSPVAVPVVPDTSASELAALRATPAPVASKHNQPSTTPVSAPALAQSPAPAPLITNTATAPKSHKLIYWIITTVLAVPLTYTAKKYGLPLFKEFLAWVQTKNVVAKLETLAKTSEQKLVVDFKTVETDLRAEIDALKLKIEGKSSSSTAPVVQHSPIVPAPSSSSTAASSSSSAKL